MRTLLRFALLFASCSAFAVNFPVTTGADSGPGSLRQAILDANRTVCGPCMIVLPAPVAVDQPLRIELESPLPPITVSNLEIGPPLGTPNPTVTAIEIHGPGHGLDLEYAGNINIIGVRIQGASRSGIVVNHCAHVTLHDVEVLDSAQNGLLIADSSSIVVHNSSFSANGANGVYATRSTAIQLVGCAVGVSDDGGGGPNAANGVHLDGVHGAQVVSCSIRHNLLTGLLITGDSGENTFASTTFDDNGLLGVDLGADGPTSANAPVLESAAYNRGTTRIHGSLHLAPHTPVQIATFVSPKPDPSGYGEGAQLLDPTDPRPQIPFMTDENGVANFTIDVAYSPRGVSLRHQFITAIATTIAGSSEFSNAVEVVDGEPNFVVTNTLDAGPGSLRDAIGEANRSAVCSAIFPCGIVFNIAGPPGPSGVYTIRPISPLPPITQSALWIEGNTQRASGGDTNPNGPEIDIDGSACGACNGIEGTFTLLREIAIGGFSGDGIAVTAPDAQPPIHRVIDGCYVGIDPTGTAAVPNGRGISTAAASLTLSACVVSGNRSDGIAVLDGTTFMDHMLIGTDRTGSVPVGNGGNGIRSSGATAVLQSTIAFNADRGVTVENPKLQNVIDRNNIHSNGSLGIDIGNDGVTPDGTPDVEDAPVITSARRANGTTEITFRAPLPPPSMPPWFVPATLVSFYNASFADASGRGEGRTYITERVVYPSEGGDQVISVDIPAGKYITATATPFEANDLFQPAGTTSEFSVAVQVTTDDCPALAPLIESAYSWSPLPGATEYRVWFRAPRDEPKIAYRGSGTRTNLSLQSGSEWWVEARFDPCYGTQSEHRFVP